MTNEPLINALEEINARMGNGHDSTGFVELDKIFNPSGFSIVAGAIDMGHYEFILNMALNLAKSGRSIIFYTGPKSSSEVMTDFLSLMGHINRDKLESGDLTEKEKQNLLVASRDFSELKITVLEHWYKNLLDNPDFQADYIFINNASYVDMLKATVNISKTIPVIASIDLVKETIHKRPDKRPRMLDLPSDYASAATNILAVYRPDYYDHTDEHAGKIEVILAKSPNHTNGSFHVAWMPKWKGVHNIAKVHKIK